MEIPGLELLMSSISHSVRNRLDALVALIHWLIIKEESKCVDESGEGEKLSELLPAGWNSSSDEYTLHYVKGNRRFTLKVLRMDQAALVHLMEDSTDKLAVLNINVNDVISFQFKDFQKMFENIDEFYAKFKSEVSPALQAPSVSQPTSSQSERQDCDPLRSDPLRADPLRAQPRRPYDPYNSGAPFSDPSGLGVGDLDPLRAGRPGGGGMIFDPFRGGGGIGGRMPRNPSAGLPPGGFLPPGAVPPGARFDPFGPDVDGRGPYRSGPGPDHMRPPDFDDQFM